MWIVVLASPRDVLRRTSFPDILTQGWGARQGKGMQQTFAIAGLVIAALAFDVQATVVANAQHQDGTQIALTDQTFMDCTQLGYTGLAYVSRPDGSQQPHCFGVNWDAGIVTLLPLVERSQSKRIWGSLGAALTGASSRVQQRANGVYDYGQKFSVPANAFAWVTSQSQGWLPASPPQGAANGTPGPHVELLPTPSE